MTDAVEALISELRGWLKNDCETLEKIEPLFRIVKLQATYLELLEHEFVRHNANRKKSKHKRDFDILTNYMQATFIVKIAAEQARAAVETIARGKK